MLPLAATSPKPPTKPELSIQHQHKQHTPQAPLHSGVFSCSQPPVTNITATLDPYQHRNALSLRSLGHRRNTPHSPPTHKQPQLTHKPMTFTSTQTTELSLDQLDDISAGWVGGAIKGAVKLGRLARASNVIRSGAQAIGRTVQNGARSAGGKVVQKATGWWQRKSFIEKASTVINGAATLVWSGKGIATGNWL